MPQGNVDVLKLRSKGKAKVTEQAGTVSLKSNDAIGALQAIARQASIRIDLAPEEVEQISGTGKLPISIAYANNVSGATEAAKKILILVGQAHAAGGQNKFRLGKVLGFVSLLLIIGVVVFFLTYRLLEKAYG